MKAIILAAGRGTRLNPLTVSVPKALVRVNELSIIEYQIEGYLSAGLSPNDIYIVIGYHADEIIKHLDKYKNINFVINNDYATTNNMYSLYLAMQKVKFEDTLFINNGDCIYDKNIIIDMANDSEPNQIAVDTDEYNEESMKVTLNKMGRITSIAKAINKLDAYGSSIDLYKFNYQYAEKFFAMIKFLIETKNQLNQWTEFALNNFLSTNEFMPYKINKKKWIEIDNYDDLLKADFIFSNFNIKQKKCIVSDMDGTIYLGNKPIKKTVNFFKHSKHDVYFMTNNTSKTKGVYASRLNEIGIKCNESKIITPSRPLIDYLNKENIKKIYPIGNSRFLQNLQNNIKHSIKFTSENCDCVLLAYDTGLTYDKLAKASIILQNENVKYIATHQDVVCPTEFGPIPDIGSFVELLFVVTNRMPEMYFGKPNPMLLNEIRKKYTDDEIVIIGDRLYTDKKLADNANIDFVLVLSGETTRDDVQWVKRFPKLIVKNLGVFDTQ